MCDIWKTRGGRELQPEDFERLPATLREINLTGGEPLLRDDLPDVVAAIRGRCRGARIVLSTNGLLPGRLEKLLGRTGPMAVRVSIDGIGGVHDRIRGVEGAFEKALESLRVARAAGTADLGICATMSRQNAGSIRTIQDLACAEQVQFTFTVAHSSPVFFGDQSDQSPDAAAACDDMETVRTRLYSSVNPKDWFRAYFVSGLIDVVSGRPRPVNCRAGTDFFYMDPEGNVYPCHLWERPMGNILEASYQEIAEGNARVIRAASTCGKRCWMTCTVAPEMRRKIMLYAARVGWAKLIHHLRRAFVDR
jgi:MoaA/NifB/PqqE/SkfB family radical SAM enzyme